MNTAARRVAAGRGNVWPPEAWSGCGTASALKKGRGLTSAGVSGKVRFPKITIGVAIAFPASQEREKVLPHILPLKPLLYPAGDFHILAG